MDNAFTSKYYPNDISCNYCELKIENPHLCICDKSNITKIQVCNVNIDLFCNSCIFICSPEKQLLWKFDEYVQNVNRLKIFDKVFLKYFNRKVKEYLIDNTFACCRCYSEIKDYKSISYDSLYTTYCRERLESL